MLYSSKGVFNMTKEEFNLLEILKQLEYVNLNLKQGQTLRAIAKVIGISKTTIRDRVSKIGYQYNATNKLYEKVSSEGIQIDHEVIKTQQEEPKEVKNHIRDTTKKIIAEPIKELVISPVRKQVFNIPVKVVCKHDTQPYTVTSTKTLINKLDKLFVKKNYKSRNELINVILELALDNEE